MIITNNMAAGSAGEPEPPRVRVGDIVSCLTCLDARIEGEVLAYDESSKLLALSILFITEITFEIIVSIMYCEHAQYAYHAVCYCMRMTANAIEVGSVSIQPHACVFTIQHTHVALSSTHAMVLDTAHPGLPVSNSIGPGDFGFEA